jgi:hypothetical protein
MFNVGFVVNLFHRKTENQKMLHAKNISHGSKLKELSEKEPNPLFALFEQSKKMALSVLWWTINHQTPHLWTQKSYRNS